MIVRNGGVVWLCAASRPYLLKNATLLAGIAAGRFATCHDVRSLSLMVLPVIVRNRWCLLQIFSKVELGEKLENVNC